MKTHLFIIVFQSVTPCIEVIILNNLVAVVLCSIYSSTTENIYCMLTTLNENTLNTYVMVILIWFGSPWINYNWALICTTTFQSGAFFTADRGDKKNESVSCGSLHNNPRVSPSRKCWTSITIFFLCCSHLTDRVYEGKAKNGRPR